MDEEVKELREKLRVGRNQTTGNASQTIDGTSADLEGIGRSDARSEQSVLAYLPGSSTEDDSTHEPHHDPERGANEKSVGRGSTNRRSSKDSSSTLGHSAGVRGTKRRSGGIEADDAIPERQKPKPAPKPKASKSSEETEKSVVVQRGKETGKTGTATSEGKDEKQGFKIPWFKEGSTLTKAETVALQEPLVAALAADLYYVDQFIWNRTADETQMPIWSDMDDEDLTVMARVMLRQGERSPQAATMVRSIVGGSDYISALMLTVPRVIKTVDRMKAAPPRAKVNWLERKRAARGV